MRNETGFAMMDVVVAALVGASMVVGTGLLTTRLVHHRAGSDALSVTTQLAEARLESLRSLASPKTHPSLLAGAHGPFYVDERGTASLGGPYTTRWVVVDDSPLPTSKRITVTVTNLNDPYATTELVTYYRVP